MQVQFAAYMSVSFSRRGDYNNMYAILTIVYQDSTYDFSWIGSPHAIDPPATVSLSPPVDTEQSVCCLIGSTYLDVERREYLQQEILTAAQRLSFDRAGAAQEQRESFHRPGTLLFTQLLPESIQQQLIQLPPGSTLQLVTDDLNWPWELLHDGRDFLALQHNITRLPRLAKARPQRNPMPQTSAGSAKVTCLLLGNPTGDLPGTIDEITAVEDILFVARERVTYRSLFGAHITADYLQDQLTTERYDLIHYAGHATPDSLLLVNAPFQTDRLQAGLPHNPVVVLNACATGRTTSDETTLHTMSQNAQSLAASFIQAGAAAVIGMLWPIPDAAAAHFGRALYTHLTAGVSIGSALRLSRHELRQQDPHGIAWLAPVLYGNGQHQPIPVALKSAVGTVLAVHFPEPPVDLRQGERQNAEEQARSLAMLAQRVGQYGGTLFQLTDVRLLATFGLYQPNDNSALNALSVAQDLMAQLKSWQITPPSIGIAADVVATRAVMDSTDTTVAPQLPLLMGAAVQQAEQLATLATPGQVLINALVRQRSTDYVHTQPWPLDASDNTVLSSTSQSAFELISSPLSVESGSPALDFSVTVGRKAEQALLKTIWQEVQQGQGHAIGISGEPGVGKSHLLQTFRRYVLQGGETGDGKTGGGETQKAIEQEQELQGQAHWLQIGCTIDLQHTPYGLLARLFHSLLALPDDATPMQCQELLHTRFPNQSSTDIALVADLLGLTQSTAQRQERAVYQNQLARLLIALVVEKVMEMPLVVAIEDAHWSDAASLDVLTLLANRVEDGPILFCVAYRPEWQPPWVGKAYFQAIQLNALSRTESQQLYQELLDTTQLPDELMTLIKRSTGNPLFLTEILMTLLHRGLLVPDSETDEWHSSGMLPTQDLPDSVHRVIDMRLEQLADNTWEVLAMAAVLGSGFTPQMLTRGLPLGEEELYTQLALLTEQNFLRASLLEEKYRFRHELIRDVVYLKIPLPQRQLWHRQVAERLEEEEDRRREAVSLLAHHYYHSLTDGNAVDDSYLQRVDNPTSDLAVVKKALLYLIKSGQDALERYGGSEAFILFRRADDLWRRFQMNASHRERIYHGLGDAHRLLNNFSTASEAYAEAYAALHRWPLTAETRPQVAALARVLARLAMWKANYPLAEAWIAAGLAQVTDEHLATCQAETALLHIQMGSICFNQGNYLQAVDHCETGLRIAETYQNEEAIADGNHVLGATLRKLGRLEEALACYDQSLEIHQRQENLYQCRQVEMNIGIVHFHLGHWERAISYYDKVIPFFREIDDQTMLASMSINMGLAQQYLGNWPAAEENFQQALLSSGEIQNQLLISLSHCNLGTLYVLQESWHDARVHLLESLSILNERQSKAHIADLKAHLALVAMAMAEWKEAQELAEEAVASATEQGDQQNLAVALRCQGRLFLALQQLQQAHACLERSHAVFDAIGNRYERERTSHWLAATYQQQGNEERARELYTEAVTTFTALGAQQDLRMAKTALEQPGHS